MNGYFAVLISSHISLLAILLRVLICLGATALSHAQEPEPAAGERQPQRWAVILVGLPGDAEHAAMLRKMADDIQKWLIESQQIPPDKVLRLPEETKDRETSAATPTAESMHTLLSDASSKLQIDDALWVFTLGHGNYDGRKAWWHVAGKDPSNEEVGRWLSDVGCREQVIWLTHSSSGWFVKPLSRPGRIVIAATATDDESNETEFLHAMATVVRFPVSRLDGNKDQAVSVAELYTAVVNEVARRFQDDHRIPTEHAQLDDNGDGLGTEIIEPGRSDDTPPDAPAVPKSKMDGDLAKLTLIPYPSVQPARDEPKSAE